MTTNSPTLEDLTAAELELEELSTVDGIARYRSTREKLGEASTGPGHAAVARSIAPVVEAIKAELELAKGRTAGRMATSAKIIALVSPEKLAFLTARQVLNSMMKGSPVNAVAHSIARLVKDEIEMDKLKAQAPGLHRFLDTRVRKTVTAMGKQKLARGALKRAQVAPVQWTETDRLKLGLKLIELFIGATGIAEIGRDTISQNNTPLVLKATPATQEWFQGAHAHNELLSPVYRPMVVPPRKWIGPTNGGYLKPRPQLARLIHSRVPGFQDEASKPEVVEQMAPVYRALNGVQETAWRINKEVLKVMTQLFGEGSTLGGLPPAEDAPLPPRPANYEDDPEAAQQWRRAAGHVHEINAGRASKWQAAASYIRTATEFAEFPAIYFPHFLDWRGRLYPLPSYLTPQGDDRCRGLLEFAAGEPLGEGGGYWLAVHVANVWGFDKAPFDERVQWVMDHEAAIMDSAMDPLDGERFWATAGDPWQALASSREWLGYKLQGADYVSHLPISMDGTCNGLQHLSAMLRDPIGGAEVNLVPRDRPGDIYTAVAKVVQQRVGAMAIEGGEDAQDAARWVGKVSRKVVKRPVMTLPYGVSRFGMADQIKAVLDEALTAGEPILEGDTHKAAAWLSVPVYEACGEVVVAARSAMDWLQALARVAAEADKPLAWTTPVGMLCHQAYPKVSSKKVNTLVGSTRYQVRVLEDVEGTIDRRRMANGISPNFVHSMDAAHLVDSVNRLMDQGITSFGMIHDSYATHACHIETLHETIRQSFVSLYSANRLEEFRTQIMDQLPEELRAQIPEVPPMGSLDINAVLESEYFFA